jgi:chromosome segregation ATPase
VIWDEVFMKRRLTSLLVLAFAAGGLVVMAASCQEQAKSVDIRPVAQRVTGMETTLQKVSGLADRLNAQVVTLQGKDEGLSKEIAGLTSELGGLKGSVDELRKSVDSLRADVQATKNANAALQKKVDDLSARIGGIDQRLWVLEARYNDHLRKYHGGG